MADRHNRDIDRPRAPLPEPLPVPTVDAHAHMEIVTDAAFDSQEVADVIAEAKSVNVDRIVQVGYSAEQSKWCVAAAEKWNTSVLAAVALHPNEAPVVADLEADLKIIEDIPVLVLQGTKDRLVYPTRNWVAEMKRLEMNYIYDEIDGADHSFFVSKNKENMKKIFDFFAEHRDQG